MRRLLGSVLVALALALASVGGVAAHVHGITPLNCLDENENSGANRADDNDTPITGLIPRDVGSAPLGPGDGGRDAAPCD